MWGFGFGSNNSIGRVTFCGEVGWEFESLLLPIKLIKLS